jgi:hypothetical protein
LAQLPIAVAPKALALAEYPIAVDTHPLAVAPEPMAMDFGPVAWQDSPMATPFQAPSPEIKDPSGLPVVQYFPIAIDPSAEPTMFGFSATEQ